MAAIVRHRQDVDARLAVKSTPAQSHRSRNLGVVCLSERHRNAARGEVGGG